MSIHGGVTVTIQAGVTVCPSRRVWLCAHLGGCDCVSIHGGVTVCPPAGSYCVPTQQE